MFVRWVRIENLLSEDVGVQRKSRPISGLQYARKNESHNASSARTFRKSKEAAEITELKKGGTNEMNGERSARKASYAYSGTTIHFSSTFPPQPASLLAVIVCITAFNIASLSHSTSIQTSSTARMENSREMGVMKRLDDKGFGFVIRDYDSSSVFYHVRELGGVKSLVSTSLHVFSNPFSHGCKKL